MPFDALRSSTRATSTSAKTIALMADLTHCVAISTATREFGVALTSNKSFASSPSNVRKFPPPPPPPPPVGCCSEFVLDGRGGSRQILAFDREHRLRHVLRLFLRPFIDFVSTTFSVVLDVLPPGAFGDPLFFFLSLSFLISSAIIVFHCNCARANPPPVNL